MHFDSEDDSEQYLINMPVGMTYLLRSLQLYYIYCKQNYIFLMSI